MKGKYPQIVLLGNNSGTNLGDAAILASIMDSVSKELPDAKFYVPSIKPEFITKNYGNKYNVKAVNVLPYTGSIRLFGIPTIYYMAKSDLAFICDGIIFGYKIWSPHNFLTTLFLLMPFAILFNCKIVCYSCGIGPFPNLISKLFAKWLINASDLVTMRENDSIDLAKEIGVTKEMHLTGDAAFLNQVSDEKIGEDILVANGLDPKAKYLGINITSYIDGWLYGKDEKVSDKDALLNTLINGIKKSLELCNNEFKPLLFSTHPMDENISQRMAEALNTKVIDNTRYLSHDIQAVMLKCELFIGMRFHSLVLASAVYSPIIGLIYAPKVRGYFRLLNCEDLGLELAKITSEDLANTIKNSWNNRNNLRQKQKIVVDGLKDRAKKTAKLIRERYFLELS